MKCCAYSLAALLTTAAAGIARLEPAPWPYQEMFGKADFVVIAKVVAATRETSEPGGVITEFESLLVLKGSGPKRFRLHHYRDTVATVNGPTRISFDPKTDASPYLLFLTREADGGFAPVAGQDDPQFSVQKVVGSSL